MKGANGHCVEQAEPCIESSPEDGSSDNDDKDHPLIYKISDRPPIHLIFFFGLQQAIISIAHQLVVSLLVAQVVCAGDDPVIKTRLLSSTLFMTGFTTLLMVTVGSRLPLFQGAAIEYLSPLLLLGTVDSTFCTTGTQATGEGSSCAGTTTPSLVNIENVTSALINSTGDGREHIYHAITSLLQENKELGNKHEHINANLLTGALLKLQGSLIVAGAIHTFIGATGLVGILLRFIGPMTIVPAVLLIGLYMIKATAKFVIINIPIAVITALVTIILSLYLGKLKTPIPAWSRRRGCHITKYPFHQVFAILIGMVVGTIACTIVTVHDLVPDDPTHPQYKTRIDVKADVLQTSNWFYFPYPGQFGPLNFSSSALVGCLLATILSILDSVGDYFACAKTCRVPPPPRHAVNRGLAVEGLCSLLSGAVGCGHATTTYAGNIGAMGLTRVASRWVFIAVGILYMVSGVIGKFSAVFITIPDPVLGGALICITGVFIGVILSNLGEISLDSSRNMAILGLSLLVGIMVPYFIENNPDLIDTDNVALKNFLKMFFGNANFAGALCAFIMDNTVPGTREERGLLSWHNPTAAKSNDPQFLEKESLYNPWMPDDMRTSKWLKFIPFLPEPELSERKQSQADKEEIEIC